MSSDLPFTMTKLMARDACNRLRQVGWYIRRQNADGSWRAFSIDLKGERLPALDQNGLPS